MNSDQEIFQQPKTAQQQGLSYYQATQELRNSGYSDETIRRAADVFNYTTFWSERISLQANNSRFYN